MRTTGFTLVEVVVVLAIMGLIVSLTVPALDASLSPAIRLDWTDSLRATAVREGRPVTHVRAIDEGLVRATADPMGLLHADTVTWE